MQSVIHLLFTYVVFTYQTVLASCPYRYASNSYSQPTPPPPPHLQSCTALLMGTRDSLRIFSLSLLLNTSISNYGIERISSQLISLTNEC